VRGISQLGQLCENVLQYRHRLLQNVIIPIARDSKTFGRQRGVSCASRADAACDFDDEALLEAGEVEDILLKWYLPPEFEPRETPAAEQSPHRCFSVGWLATHLLGEMADALGDRPMVWCLQARTPHPSPNFVRRHPKSELRSSRSHKGRGEVGGYFARSAHTRIGIST
jgi:hypothetical protein